MLQPPASTTAVNNKILGGGGAPLTTLYNTKLHYKTCETINTHR